MTLYNFLGFLQIILVINEIFLVCVFAWLVCYGLDLLGKSRRESRLRGKNLQDKEDE